MFWKLIKLRKHLRVNDLVISILSPRIDSETSEEKNSYTFTYIFWELTSISSIPSYKLISYNIIDAIIIHN